MKKLGTLLIVLVLVLSSVSALAALPEGYVYEPWRGDAGGVIAAEITRLNPRGIVSDHAALDALPPFWQTSPVVATLARHTIVTPD